MSIQAIRLRVDWDRLTWEEFELLEQAGTGQFSFRLMRPLVAKFMVDEQGQAIPAAEAEAELGRLTRPQILEVVGALAAQLRDTAVPPASGGSS